MECEIKINDAVSITVERDDDGSQSGSIITSGLHGQEGDEDYNEEYEAAIDGFESFLLSLYSAGVDVSTQAFKDAIITTIDAIGNNY